MPTHRRNCSSSTNNDCHITIRYSCPSVRTLPLRQKMLQSQSPLTIFLNFTLYFSQKSFTPLLQSLRRYDSNKSDLCQVQGELIRIYHLITLLPSPFTPRSIRARPFSRSVQITALEGNVKRVYFDAPDCSYTLLV